MTQGFKNMAMRTINAENIFILNIVEQFKKTHLEAGKILEVFKNVKAVKLDSVNGRYVLTHGAYWDKPVIDNALKMASK